MRPIKSFELPQSMITAIGTQWLGKYVVHELDAREFVQCQSSATSFMIEDYATQNRGKPENEQLQWDGIIPEDVMRKFIVCKSTVKDGIELNPVEHLPSKLYDALAMISLPANIISPQEFKTLFLSSATSNPAILQPKST